MNDKDKKPKPERGNKPSPDREKVDRGIDLYDFKVNGVELTSRTEKLSVENILKLAKEKGAFPGEVAGYILQGENDPYQPGDEVNLRDEKHFITIPNQGTEVA